MNTFSLRAIKAHLGTQLLGKKIHVFDELDSTNLEAYRMAREGGEEGEVVVADRQLRGKGRLGRQWLSPPGVNLYVSIILRPPIVVRNAPLITLMAAIATVKATKGISGLQPQIKWPNDLLINNKKVAGLLNEMKCKAGKVEFIVLGIGINVNMTLEVVPEEMRSTATSLREELGYDISRVEFLSALLREVEREYQAFLTGEPGRILRQWEEFSQMVGKFVEMRSFNEVIRGKVKGIDSNGSLLLSTPDGSERRVIAGDISHPGEFPDMKPELEAKGK
ncbi:MAG: biotin--[acetyl-CoA-carboxylase] ligase [Deltaproteobacteria bacterium]|nr:biotin--[acetyl-CoA-carboxylase] ligase [Deltaproteobacteria bacterium]